MTWTFWLQAVLLLNLKVNKTQHIRSLRLAGNDSNSSGDVDPSGPSQKVSGYRSFAACIIELPYGVPLTEFDSPGNHDVHERQTWGAASEQTLDSSIVLRIQ